MTVSVRHQGCFFFEYFQRSNIGSFVKYNTSGGLLYTPTAVNIHVYNVDDSYFCYTSTSLYTKIDMGSFLVDPSCKIKPEELLDGNVDIFGEKPSDFIANTFNLGLHEYNILYCQYIADLTVNVKVNGVPGHFCGGFLYDQENPTNVSFYRIFSIIPSKYYSGTVTYFEKEITVAFLPFTPMQIIPTSYLNSNRGTSVFYDRGINMFRDLNLTILNQKCEYGPGNFYPLNGLRTKYEIYTYNPNSLGFIVWVSEIKSGNIDGLYDKYVNFSGSTVSLALLGITNMGTVCVILVYTNGTFSTINDSGLTIPYYWPNTIPIEIIQLKNGANGLKGNYGVTYKYQLGDKHTDFVQITSLKNGSVISGTKVGVDFACSPYIIPGSTDNIVYLTNSDKKAGVGYKKFIFRHNPSTLVTKTTRLNCPSSSTFNMDTASGEYSYVLTSKNEYLPAIVQPSIYVGVYTSADLDIRHMTGYLLNKTINPNSSIARTLKQGWRGSKTDYPRDATYSLPLYNPQDYNNGYIVSVPGGEVGSGDTYDICTGPLGINNFSVNDNALGYFRQILELEGLKKQYIALIDDRFEPTNTLNKVMEVIDSNYEAVPLGRQTVFDSNSITKLAFGSFKKDEVTKKDVLTFVSPLTPFERLNETQPVNNPDNPNNSIQPDPITLLVDDTTILIPNLMKFTNEEQQLLLDLQQKYVNVNINMSSFTDYNVNLNFDIAVSQWFTAYKIVLQLMNCKMVILNHETNMKDPTYTSNMFPVEDNNKDNNQFVCKNGADYYYNLLNLYPQITNISAIWLNKSVSKDTWVPSSLYDALDSKNINNKLFFTQIIELPTFKCYLGLNGNDNSYNKDRNCLMVKVKAPGFDKIWPSLPKNGGKKKTKQLKYKYKKKLNRRKTKRRL
jgi:hypothetical protein